MITKSFIFQVGGRPAISPIFLIVSELEHATSSPFRFMQINAPKLASSVSGHGNPRPLPTVKPPQNFLWIRHTSLHGSQQTSPKKCFTLDVLFTSLCTHINKPRSWRNWYFKRWHILQSLKFSKVLEKCPDGTEWPGHLRKGIKAIRATGFLEDSSGLQIAPSIAPHNIAHWPTREC